MLDCNLWTTMMMMSLRNELYPNRRWAEGRSQQFKYHLRQLIFFPDPIPFRFPRIQPNNAHYARYGGVMVGWRGGGSRYVITFGAKLVV